MYVQEDFKIIARITGYSQKSNTGISPGNVVYRPRESQGESPNRNPVCRISLI